MLRSVGVLKAYRWRSIRRTLKRPESGSITALGPAPVRRGAPITSGADAHSTGGVAPLKRGAKWHVPHFALLRKTVNPRRSASVSAPRAPAIARSDRERIVTSERT